METNWILKKFDELSTRELYAILRLRSEVFVVEQNCPYLDTDELDFESWHLMGWSNQENESQPSLLAYTRILPPGLAFEYASIGRVVTSPKARASGIGRQLMQQSIQNLYNLFGQVPIKIGAQLYLIKFYESLGFAKQGDVYLEDGIEHIKMLKNV